MIVNWRPMYFPNEGKIQVPVVSQSEYTMISLHNFEGVYKLPLEEVLEEVLEKVLFAKSSTIPILPQDVRRTWFRD